MNTNNEQHLDPQGPIECLEHLKEFVLRIDWLDQMPEIDFAKFFVLNAQVLELMTFAVHYKRYNVDLGRQHRLLQFDSRASPNARFEIINDYDRERFACRNNHHILSMAEPFGRSCEYCGQVG